MTRTHNLAYLAKMMPGVQPAAALAWIKAMPLYAQIGWGLGVWCGLAGAVLLLVRSRNAVWAFAISMLGILLSIGYQLVAAPPLAGADNASGKVMPYVVIIVGAALLAYSQAIARRTVIR